MKNYLHYRPYLQDLISEDPEAAFDLQCLVDEMFLDAYAQGLEHGRDESWLRFERAKERAERTSTAAAVRIIEDLIVLANQEGPFWKDTVRKAREFADEFYLSEFREECNRDREAR